MSMNKNLLFAFACIASGGLLFGFIIGINSNVVASGQLLCEASTGGGTWTSTGYHQCYVLDSLQQGFLSSLNIVGAVLASLICFQWSDALGRKLEVQLGAALYLTGASIAALSPVLWGVYLGFLLYGFGVGFAMHAAPVYIAEISPADQRGALVSAKEGCVVLGMCFGFALGVALAATEMIGWRWMIGGSIPFSIMMGLGISFVPESPRFLLLRSIRCAEFLTKADLKAEAQKSLKFFRHTATLEETSKEVEEMAEELTKSLGGDEVSWSDAFQYPKLLRIGCGLVFLQQITGQPSILYFASNIFRSAGLGSLAQASSLGVGVVKLIATLVAMGYVDKYGRRSLLFVGISLMAVALALVSVAFTQRVCSKDVASMAQCAQSDVTLPRAWGLTTVVGLMLYVSGYQLGFGPISWVIISEIFPLRIRGAALSLAALVNFGSNVGVTILQPVMLDAITPAGVFFLYMLLCFVSLAFVHGFVPETKGKTLEEIEAMLTPQKST